MLRNTLLKTLRDTRRALMWWSLGLIGMVALELSVYPTVRDNPELNRIAENYPDAIKAFVGFGGRFDFLSGAGYLGTELFSFMIPLLLLVAAVGAGARAIAGEEEAGRLELVLAHPLSRRRYALEKLGALVVEIAVLVGVLWLALVAGVVLVDMGVSARHLAAASASAGLLAIVFGALAVFLGAATGRRAVAVGVTAAAAVAAYLVNSLASLVSFLEPFQKASPFYHYSASDPLRHGLEVSHAAFLVVLPLVLGALTCLAFDRRDVAV